MTLSEEGLHEEAGTMRNPSFGQDGGEGIKLFWGTVMVKDLSLDIQCHWDNLFVLFIPRWALGSAWRRPVV